MHRFIALRKFGVLVGFSGTVYQTTKTETEYFEYLENIRLNPQHVVALSESKASLETDSCAALIEIDQLPSSHSITTQSLKKEVLEALATRSLTADDIKNGITWISKDDNISSILPKGIMENMPEVVLRVKDAFSPDKIKQNKENYARCLADQATDGFERHFALNRNGDEQNNNTSNPKYQLAPKMPHTTPEWEELRRRYPCSKCDDVLAASNIVPNCGHSFCGVCLIDHQQGQVVLETTTAAAAALHFTCPCAAGCTNTYRSTIFQRGQDERTKEECNEAPDCYLKRNWISRGVKYKEYTDADTAAARAREEAEEESGSGVFLTPEEWDYFMPMIIVCIAAALIVAGYWKHSK